MDLEKAIATEPIKQKLRELPKYMPKADEVLCRFASFLADRIGSDELVPEGFMITAELALYDLNKGISGFPNKPLPSNLVGYPPQIYALLGMSVPRIAKAVCPEDFAAGVQKFYDEVHKRISEAK